MILGEDSFSGMEGKGDAQRTTHNAPDGTETNSRTGRFNSPYAL